MFTSVSLLLYQVDKVARDTKMIKVSGGEGRSKTRNNKSITRQVYFVFGQWCNHYDNSVVLRYAELKCSKKMRYLLSDIYLSACTLYAFYNFDNNRKFNSTVRSQEIATVLAAQRL